MKTDDQAAAEILSMQGGDVENTHVNADALLCELLRSLGYTKTADAFEELEKWYA